MSFSSFITLVIGFLLKHCRYLSAQSNFYFHHEILLHFCLKLWGIITCAPLQGCNSPRPQKGSPSMLWLGVNQRIDSNKYQINNININSLSQYLSFYNAVFHNEINIGNFKRPYLQVLTIWSRSICRCTTKMHYIHRIFRQY